MRNPLDLFRGRSEQPAGREPSTDARRIVRAYHAATCHAPHQPARGPYELDWDTQPDPFRRYVGARTIALDHALTTDGPLYREVMESDAPIAAVSVDRASVSRLFEDSLALSAWKEYGGTRWALRVNPSSGNLHPTEGYLLCGAIEGLCDAPLLAHYAPKEHALEVRANPSVHAWGELVGGLQRGAFFVGLTSIHWREAWKYGERAYRYCQHDVGHAIACVAIAARALGWRVHLCDELGHADLVRLLGVGDARGAEAEEPECLLALLPSDVHVAARSLPTRAPIAFERLELAGDPNTLSPEHVEWDAIDAIVPVCRKSPTQGTYDAEVWPGSRHCDGDETNRSTPARPQPIRPLLHARRSAVSFDGKTSIDRAALQRMLAATLTGVAGSLPWSPRVQLGLFVHRVRGLDPGLYMFLRDPAQRTLLQSTMQKAFAWDPAAGLVAEFGLFALANGDVRALAKHVSCEQDIAGDSAVAFAMLAEFDPTLERHGAWFYPRLYWECGVVGQILYLAAEEAGVRATGIGCFFDEPVHRAFGIGSLRYRSLYHFTIGGPVDDARLTTLPSYPAASSRAVQP